ncbi:hypothetical protein HK405_012818, partial [Cladochytrium tenue]
MQDQPHDHAAANPWSGPSGGGASRAGRDPRGGGSSGAPIFAAGAATDDAEAEWGAALLEAGGGASGNSSTATRPGRGVGEHDDVEDEGDVFGDPAAEDELEDLVRQVRHSRLMVNDDAAAAAVGSGWEDAATGDG